MSIKTTLLNNKLSKLHGLVDPKSLIPETRSMFLENQNGLLVIKTINEYSKAKIVIDYLSIDNDLLIEYKKFSNLIKKINSREIDIRTYENFIFVNDDTSTYKFNSIKNEKNFNFEFDLNEYNILGRIPGVALKESLEKVEHAIAEDSNIFLNGVFVRCLENKINLLTTDQLRISYVSHDMDLNVEKDFFISAKAIVGLIPFLSEHDVEIYYKGNELLIKQVEDYLNLTFKDGHFPNLTINNNVPKLQIKKDELKSILERLSILVDEFDHIRMICKENKITFISENWYGDRFDENINISNPNNITCDLILNLKFLKDAIKHINSKSCVFQFSESLMISSPDEKHTEIILPIKK